MQIIIHEPKENITYKDIRFILKQYLMESYDIRPTLAEETIEEMFRRGTEFISLEEQAEKERIKNE